jgi:uncharacterized protein (TIGR03382 family)
MFAAAVVCAATWNGALASPSYTLINPPWTGEKSEMQMFADVYGGNWTQASNGLDYTNGTITAQRLVDKGVAGPTSLTTGVSGTDNAWQGLNAVTLTVLEKCAADNSTFGYFNDMGGDTSFHKLFNTGMIGATATIALPQNFRWALRDNSLDTMVTSHIADNLGSGSQSGMAFDQMVTYRILNHTTGAMEWVIFWEDRVGLASDHDYNDSMIRITTSPIPAPATGAIGAAGLGLISRRRRR